MLVDEITDGRGTQHHHQHGHDDGGNHHRNMGNHADSGNDRIQREHDIDDCDLDDGVKEVAALAGGAVVVGLVLAFQAVVHLLGAFPQQEQATEEQDQVAAGNALFEQHEQVGSQAHDPGDRQQQQDAGDHGQRQAEDPGALLHVLGHAADQNRDHDDVVDAENDLKSRQCKKGNPDLRVGQPFHVYSFKRGSMCVKPGPGAAGRAFDTISMGVRLLIDC
ncbi:hypothetical protein D9M71_570470 [compost metagenome]